MITNLHIKNIGIIEDIEINFNEGLNVLTGETGAGKSLIINALNIICGDEKISLLLKFAFMILKTKIL